MKYASLPLVLLLSLGLAFGGQVTETYLSNVSGTATLGTSPVLEVFRTATRTTATGTLSTTVPAAECGGISVGDTAYIGTQASTAVSPSGNIAVVLGLSVTTGPCNITIMTAISWANNDAIVVKRKTGSGTDAYATIYDDERFITQITQPFAGDSNNQWVFFAPPGRFGARVSDSSGRTLSLKTEVAYDETGWVQVTPDYDSPTAGIQEAINKLPVTGGTVYMSSGTFTVSASINITKNNVFLVGNGRRATTIISTLAGGDAFVIDLTPTNGNNGNCTFRNIEILQGTNALTSGSAVVRVESAANFHMENVVLRGSSTVDLVSSGIALELNAVTSVQLDNLWIQGFDNRRWGVGVDIGNGTSENWGNVTFNGGILIRVIVGVRIALNATNLINNIQFLGTKFKLSSSASTDGIGIDAYTQAQNVSLIGVHFEDYNNSVSLNGVEGWAFVGCRFSRFEVGTAPTGVKFVTNPSSNVSFISNIWSNNVSAGTGISLDAQAHNAIFVQGARATNVATFLSDSTTGNGIRSVITGVNSIEWDLKGAVMHQESDLRVGGVFNFGDRATPTTRTLSSDTFTMNKSYHVIAAESGTADSCATINGGGVGDILVIRADAGDTITINETGNLDLGAATRVLDNVEDHLFLINTDGSNWSETSFADNGS